MNSRLLALIERGYSKDDVIKLSSFTDEELNYACDIAFEHISRDCMPEDNKFVIYIGGQPGCGKTVLSMDLKNKIGNIVEIGIDNYRMYHPRYLEIEKCIRQHWKNRKENINDTPGNDIADFTHFFAGAMTDRLIEKASKLGYNMLLEWGMREPTGPLNTMENLDTIGYDNLVLFVSTHKDISYEACELRYDVMKDSPHIVRKVPKSFHDYCVATLPDSIDKIYSEGYKNETIDYMALITRDGNLVWDDKSNEMPGKVFNDYLNHYKHIQEKNDPTVSFNNSKKEISRLEQRIPIATKTLYSEHGQFDKGNINL